MNMEFGNLANLNLLWIVGFTAALIAVADILRRQALARFATSNLVQSLTSGISRTRRLVKNSLVVAGLTALAFALTDPRWGRVWRDVPQRGIDVVFAVDVSRSMLAEDAGPTRLERARQQITDMVDAMKGDRVGLVVFAGEAKQRVPLTTNYNDFKQALEEIGPHSAQVGGSRLGDALTTAADTFLDDTTDHKAIVLLTDGEDQDSDPVGIAKRINAEQGIRVFTVGLGDQEQGARVPVARTGHGMQWLEYNGQQVWSKLNGQVLKDLALASHGAYIPAGTRQVDMAGVYRGYIGSIEQTEFETARIHSFIPRYQWFVGAALVLLLAETLISEFRRQPRTMSVESGMTTVESRATIRRLRSPQAAKSGRQGRLIASLLMAFTAFSLLGAAPADDVDASRLVAEANEAVTEGNFDQAIEQYQRAAEQRPERPEPIYNQAVAQFRKGDLAQARDLLTQTLQTRDRALEARARFNLGNCDYAEAVAHATDDRAAAIAKLESAISHYRAALRTDATDADARANIELAGRLIDQLRTQVQDQQQQDQQQQDQQQQDQDQQDQQQQSAEKQQPQESDQQGDSNDRQQNDGTESDQQKSAGQESSEDDSSEQQSAEQNESEGSGQEQDAADSNPEQNEPSGHQEREASNSRDESTEQQTPESENSDGEPEKAEQQPASESKAEESPQQRESQTGSGEADGEPRDQTGPGTPQYGSADSAADGEARPMTKVEAEKMLQAVRDRDLKRRTEQLRKLQRRRVTVDRDW